MSSGCGFRPRRRSQEPCVIDAEVKNRNGKPRWWCHTHGCAAWASDGSRLEHCIGAGVPDVPRERVLVLDAGRYRGGVAVWGAIPAVFNSGPEPPDYGVHVHAREMPGGDKVIDATYECVVLRVEGRDYEIDAPAATALVAANVLGLTLKALHCPRCGQAHLDADEFAVNPHRKHQCNYCGRHFWDRTGDASISNPCVEVQDPGGDHRSRPVASDRELTIQQSEVGGVAIWGSNPALIWTGSRTEEAGIHVHAWNKHGVKFVDDTFGRVVIDGVELDPDQVRLLMVQRSLPHIARRIVTLACEACGSEHYDAGLAGFSPRNDHTCDSCGALLVGNGHSNRKVVSNPVLRQLEEVGGHLPPGRRSAAA